jgi:putative transposase
MPNTYSQIYIQVVFAVQGRQSLIDCTWEERLYQYMTGIIKSKGQKLIAINGMPDHIQLFIGLQPNCCLSDLVREVKKSSNDFINQNQLSSSKFYWQEGFGAFSYGHSQIDRVVKYILNQKQHHQKYSFKKEYIQFLQKFEIDHDEKYLFDWQE